MKTRSFTLFLLAIIVFIAGCVGQGGGGGGAGTCGSNPGGANEVHVTEFSPSFNEFETGEQMDLIFSIKNSGSLQATDVNYYLFGLSVPEWTIESSGVPTPAVGPIPGPNLEPPDPSSNIGGDEESVEWQITHTISRGVVVPYTMEARAYFSYTTTSENNIKIATDNYIKSLPKEQQNGFKNSLGITTSIPSRGPLTVSVQSDKKIFKGATVSIDVEIIIEDKGGGTVSDALPPAGKPNVIPRVSVSSPGRSITCTIPLTNVKLIGGKKVIHCDLPVNTLSNIGWESIPVSIGMKYIYYVGQCTTVNVVPPT